MSTHVTAQRMNVVTAAIAPFLHYSFGTYARLASQPDINDFAFGNPNDPPLAEISQTIQKWSVPQDAQWFAYKENLPTAQAAVAAALQQRRGVDFAPEDIFITNGAFAALGVALAALINPGDEVIFISPPWFFYEAYILHHGGVPVRVRVDPETFDLDLDAIAAAITPRTRAIIVNSPNNPTGKIYPPVTLQRLAALLINASQQHGAPMYLLSDEAYSRIVFDERAYPSPTEFYPFSLLLYTFGKTLLTPGERIGYLALPPAMPARAELRLALLGAQVMTGYAFANVNLQRAAADLEELSIDIAQIQRRRDHMVAALREIGYKLHVPEGTFYLLVRSPIADDVAFCEILAEQKILCLPGAVVEQPGYFRISLTANDAMISRALPGFAAAYAQVRR